MLLASHPTKGPTHARVTLTKTRTFGAMELFRLFCTTSARLVARCCFAACSLAWRRPTALEAAPVARPPVPGTAAGRSGGVMQWQRVSDAGDRERVRCVAAANLWPPSACVAALLPGASLSYAPCCAAHGACSHPWHASRSALASSAMGAVLAKRHLTEPHAWQPSSPRKNTWRRHQRVRRHRLVPGCNA